MTSIISYIYRFISEGFPLLLLILPFCIFIRLIYLNANKHPGLRREPDCVREIVMYGFFSFLILLSAQTFLFNSGPNEIRLVPFQIIIQQFIEINDNSFSREAFIFNTIGNVGIFVPIGVFAAYLFKKGAFRTALYGFYISLVIETVQIPLHRTTDVDDLILNTTGTIIGYFIYRLILRMNRNTKHTKRRMRLEKKKTIQ